MLVTYHWYVDNYSSRIVRSSRLNLNRCEQCRYCATYCSDAEEGLDDANGQLEGPFSVNFVKTGSCSGGAKHRLPRKTNLLGRFMGKNRQASRESRWGTASLPSEPSRCLRYALKIKLTTTNRSGLPWRRSRRKWVRKVRAIQGKFAAWLV